MKKGLKYYYDHLEAHLIIICLILTTVIIFVQVVMRYVFNSSLTWSEEIARYLFIWESWLGISLGARMGEHITVEMLTGKLQGRTKLIVCVIADFAVIAICAVVAWQGILLVAKMIEIRALTPVLRISMAYGYAAVPVGCGLMLLRSVETIVKRIREYRDSKPKENGEVDA